MNFTDQSYFAKIFKKYTGVTPKKSLKNEHI
ncbi:AraC family transcriptional regulator [Neobacillus vireti]